MTYNISGGALAPKWTSLTSGSATDILDLGKRVNVLSVLAETTSGTPTITLTVTDGTNTYNVRKAASIPLTFETPLPLDTNQKLQATSSDSSGHIDVCVVYVLPSATAVGRA